jgi:hypothetical protein
MSLLTRRECSENVDKNNKAEQTMARCAFRPKLFSLLLRINEPVNIEKVTDEYQNDATIVLKPHIKEYLM